MARRKSQDNGQNVVPRLKRGQAPTESREDRVRRSRGRILIVALAPLGLLLASGAVAGYLQLARFPVYDKLARANYLRHITLDDTRGQIVDRSGALLASSVDVDSVWVDPKTIAHAIDMDEVKKGADPVELSRQNVAQTAERLADALDMPYEEVYERVTRQNKEKGTYKRFVFLKRRVTARESARVKALKLPGVGTQLDHERFYPKKELAGQVLGIVGWEHQGLEGLELAYDKELRGHRARIPVLRDKKHDKSFAEDIPAIPRFAGNTLVLSLDEKIQEFAEITLEQAVIRSRALSGMAVVMDVKTGEVLAIANVPRFNPNKFREFDYSRRRNRAVNDIFEPGSTFKVFTLAAALDLGVVTLDDIINVEGGHYRVGRHIIHDTHPYDSLDGWDVVKHSSNIGFAKFGELMGRDLVHKYLTDFGFGQRAATGLPGEASGQLRPTKDWAPVTFANICFGQGVTTSALQLTRAMSAVANGGKLMRPILVRELRDSNGTVLFRNLPRVERQVVSEETAAQVMAALAGVVEEDGTGPAARSDLYSVVGKTGTAQKPDHLVGGYSHDRWIGSFLGAAPLEDPRIAVLVLIDEPLGKAYGGVVAAPAFRSIVDWTLDYLGVPPTRVPYHRSARIRRGAGLEAAARAGAEAEPDIALPDDGYLGTDDGASEVFVPDFRGLTMSEVRTIARQSRVNVLYTGSGTATRQRPPFGVRVPAWTTVDVSFTHAGPAPLAPAKNKR